MKVIKDVGFEMDSGVAALWSLAAFVSAVGLSLFGLCNWGVAGVMMCGVSGLMMCLLLSLPSQFGRKGLIYITLPHFLGIIPIPLIYYLAQKELILPALLVVVIAGRLLYLIRSTTPKRNTL